MGSLITWQGLFGASLNENLSNWSSCSLVPNPQLQLALWVRGQSSCNVYSHSMIDSEDHWHRSKQTMRVILAVCLIAPSMQCLFSMPTNSFCSLVLDSMHTCVACSVSSSVSLMSRPYLDHLFNCTIPSLSLSLPPSPSLSFSPFDIHFPSSTWHQMKMIGGRSVNLLMAYLLIGENWLDIWVQILIALILLLVKTL